MAGQTIIDYKQIIVNRLLEDSELLKALINLDSDFLSRSITLSPEDIIYNFIYPYMDSKNVLSETKTFITMEFKNFHSIDNNNYYNTGEIVFYIICHANLIRTDYGNRYDYIFERIKNIFHKTKLFGIGETFVSSWGDLAIDDDYYGCYCVVSVNDFNF